jgi:hypothetical protein
MKGKKLTTEQNRKGHGPFECETSALHSSHGRRAARQGTLAVIHMMKRQLEHGDCCSCDCVCCPPPLRPLLLSLLLPSEKNVPDRNSAL